MCAAIYGPEQLAAMRDCFDQACGTLRAAGHRLSSVERDQLAGLIIHMTSAGVDDDGLVEATVSVALRSDFWISRASARWSSSSAYH